MAPSLEMPEKQLDTGAAGRYLFAVIIQMVVASTAFGFVDLFCYGPLPNDSNLGGPLPWQAVVAIFFGMSLRSRVFSPLDNSRPDLNAIATAEEDKELLAVLDSGKTRQKVLMADCEKRGLAVDNTMDRPELERRLRRYLEETRGAEFGSGDAASGSSGKTERLMPSWTPPGVVFPLMWVGFVAPLRAVASSLVYETSTGRLNEAHLNDPVLLWLLLHLCLGDTWNTINNVEQRTGAAVPGVVFVLLSTLFTAKQYYDIVPLAGLLLALTAVWIAIAGALVIDTWRINDAVEPEPLYPYKATGRKSITRLFFEY